MEGIVAETGRRKLVDQIKLVHGIKPLELSTYMVWDTGGGSMSG